MAKRITPEESTKLKLLEYGMPGSLKTRTAATAAWDDRTAPALHFDIGGNTLALTDYKVRPDLVLIEDIKELNPFYNWIKQGQKENSPLVAQFQLQPPYKTIIIDGVTDIQRSVMQAASGQPYVDPATMPNPMERQHFNKVLATMTNFAYLFFHLDLHIIVTALERRFEDKNQNIFFSPLLLGQSSTEVAGYAYAVARMMHIERLSAPSKRAVDEMLKAAGDASPAMAIAKFKPSAFEVAKDQHGFGVDIMPNPTVTKLLDLMEARREQFGPSEVS